MYCCGQKRLSLLKASLRLHVGELGEVFVEWAQICERFLLLPDLGLVDLVPFQSTLLIVAIAMLHSLDCQSILHLSRIL